MNALWIFMHPKRALLCIERLESDLEAQRGSLDAVIRGQGSELERLRAELKEERARVALLEERERELNEARGKELATLNDIVDEWLNGKEGDGE